MGLIKNYFLLFIFLIPTLILSQEISLFQQFNGHYDYLAFGNTLNKGENTG